MWSKLAAIDVKMVRVALGWSTGDRVDWLLKGGTRQMRGCVMREVVCMLMQRDRDREMRRKEKMLAQRGTRGGIRADEMRGLGRVETNRGTRERRRRAEVVEEKREADERMAIRARNIESRRERAAKRLARD